MSHTYWFDEGIGATSLCGKATRESQEPAPDDADTCVECQEVMEERGWLHLHRRPYLFVGGLHEPEGDGNGPQGGVDRPEVCKWCGKEIPEGFNHDEGDAFGCREQRNDKGPDSGA